MKNMNIMFGKRKGITPVIALVLLLMMTVAAAGMAYIWFQDVQQETQDTVSDSLSQRTEQMAGAISIDAVYEPGVANEVRVAIRNTGSVTYTGDVVVYVGAELCTTAATVNSPQASAVALCPSIAGGLTDQVIVRAIPPAGSAVQITCDLKGAVGDDQYCAL
ncbi:MAG: hypothetical protein KAT83_00215 [Candidatus Aenigmarchaeota archaeon]|nr:hypothetical protein [Candidatus Aenigmarchaeota archaeon]